ncbi:MAG: ATP-grasp domain-containing protein [bacterium]
MSQQRVNIMMTCVNSQVAPSIIQLIYEHPDYEVHVVGCDASPAEEILGQSFCESCYSVPPGMDDTYIQAILNIVEKHHIQLIFPGSDEECLTLSRYREELQSRGCDVACSAYEKIALASNKYRMIMKLKEAGIRSSEAYVPQTLEDIEKIAKRLGYPEREVVIKPQFGRGSKGFKVITSQYDRYEAFCREKHFRISLEELKTLFAGHEEDLPNYLMMEMYPGDKYSADILVSHGKVISIVIRNNGPLPKINPPTQIATIVFDQDVRTYAESIVKLMGFDYFVQIEIGRDIEGGLGFIEINTRIDATLPITTGLGLNFFREMITYAITGQMRSDIPDYRDFSKQLRFRRYWQHLFEELSSAS